jgi:hypothetical protein
VQGLPNAATAFAATAARRAALGRPKHKCKDCGTGYCQHGRRKGMCKDCGTGYCQHGRPKHTCKDCGTGHCEHSIHP